ncbi:MAG: helix-turn-helix domain-containing protein [Hellea sp.]|nr:helix-turn-helix domain-containing protein [Hellea sp.]
MKNIGHITVARAYLIEVAKILIQLGVDQAELFAELAIDPSTRPHPKERVSLGDLSDLLNFAKKNLNNPVVGLHAGARFRIATYNTVGNILGFCQDLEEAAFINRRYAGLVHTIGVLHLIKENSGDKVEARFIWLPNFGPESDHKYCLVNDYVLTNYVYTINWLAWGFGRGVRKVSLRHQLSQKNLAGEYERMFGCPVEFDAADYTVELESGILNMPLPTANPAKLAILRAKHETVLASHNGLDSLQFRVEQKIREIIQSEKPSIEIVARELDQPVRSLKRRLKDNQTSFRAISEQVKKDLSDSLITENVPLAQIAQSLWYSDQAAFTRAFKNWYDVTPGQYRR